MQKVSNSVFLCGQIVRVESDEGLCIVRIMRLSGSYDSIPCQWETSLPLCARAGKYVQLSGKLIGQASDPGMPLFVLTESIAPLQKAVWENHVTLYADLCAPPQLRQTPRGREVCDLMLSQEEGGPIPAIIWGKAAHRMQYLPEGTALFVQGRLQSRPGRRGKPLCELSVCHFTPLE